MAFGTKYRASFKVPFPGSAFERTWQADLMKEAGAGATALTTSDTPIRYTLTKEDPLTPYGIARTQCILEVVGEDTAFDEIRTAGPKAWVLALTHANTNAFIGYVEPWRMRKIVGPGPVVQQIVATDGLDYLKSINWYDTQAAARSGGFQTPIDIIDRILNDNLPYSSATGGYGFYSSNSWYNYNSGLDGWGDVDPDDPLWSYAHDVGALWAAMGGDDQTGRIPTMYDALDHILRVWQVYLTWGVNRWNLKQVAHYDGGGTGAYHWTYTNLPGQSAEGTATTHILWDDDAVVLDGNRYVVEHGPQYRKAVVTYEHNTTAAQLLDPFWTNTTFNWTKSDAALTTTQATFPELRERGVFNIPTLQLTPIVNNTETSKSNLVGPVDVRTDFLALVANAATPLYVTDASIYDIEGTVSGGNTNSITFTTSALYSVSADAAIAYTYYLAGFAIGLDDGTDSYWLKTDGTWTKTDADAAADPGDDEIWTKTVAGTGINTSEGSTTIALDAVQLPESDTGDLFTVHVRLYQGFDPYQGFHGSSTVNAFGWGETVLGLLVDGSSEVQSFEITVENTGSGSVHRLEETLYTGSGPNNDSPLRIALDSAPFNGVTYASWTTDSGLVTGTDTSYTHAELWGRELLKMYGTAPEIIRARLRLKKTTYETFDWGWYLRADIDNDANFADYYITSGTVTGTKEGLTLDLVAVEIRQDSLTITTAELYPNPWPPILPMVPVTDIGVADDSGGGSTGGTYENVHPCTIAVYDCKQGADNTILYDRLDGNYHGTITGGTFDGVGLEVTNGKVELPTSVFNATSPSKMTVLFAIGDEGAASFADNDFNILNIEHSGVRTVQIDSAAQAASRIIQSRTLGTSVISEVIGGTTSIMGALAFSPGVDSWHTGALDATAPILYLLSNENPGVYAEEDTVGLADHTWPTSAPDFVRVCEAASGKTGKILWLEIIHCHLTWHEIKPQLDRIRGHLESRNIPGDGTWEGQVAKPAFQPPLAWAQPPGTTCILAPTTGSWTDDSSKWVTMGTLSDTTTGGYVRDVLGFASGVLLGTGAATRTLKRRGIEMVATVHNLSVLTCADIVRDGQFTLVHVIGNSGMAAATLNLNVFTIGYGNSVLAEGSLIFDMNFPASNGFDLSLTAKAVSGGITTYNHVAQTGLFASQYTSTDPSFIVLRLDVDAEFCSLSLLNNTTGGLLTTGNLWDVASGAWAQTGDSSIPWVSVDIQGTDSASTSTQYFTYFQAIERILPDAEIEELYLALRPWLIQTRGFGTTELPENP